MVNNEASIYQHHIFESSAFDDNILARPAYKHLLPNQMDHITIPDRPPSPCASISSSSSIEVVVSRSPSPATGLTQVQYVPLDLHWSTLVPGGPLKERPRSKDPSKARRRLLRRASRFTPQELANIDQTRLEKQNVTEACGALLRQFSMLREVKRAKRTKISPESFETIRPFEFENGGNDPTIACNYPSTNETFSTMEHERHFVGQITIQHTLDAMRQALSEYPQFNLRAWSDRRARKSNLRTESGRLSFFVDAAVSRDNDLTGLAVVWKTDRRCSYSPWTARGYRVEEALDQETAETVAIWQALQFVRSKALEQNAVTCKDPCSLAVIYSDSQSALRRIANEELGSTDIVHRIRQQSEELDMMGVKVHLYWVPGHRDVPGNALADLVAKRARQPAT